MFSGLWIHLCFFPFSLLLDFSFASENSRGSVVYQSRGCKTHPPASLGVVGWCEGAG